MRTASRRAAAGSTRFASVCHTETHMESGDGQPMATATRPPTPDRTAVAGTANAAHGPRGFPRPAIGSDRDSRRGTPRNTAHQITRIKYTNHDKPDNTSQHIGCGARRVDVPHRQQGSMPQSVITSRCAAHPNPIIQSSNHPIIHLYARRTPRPKAMRGGRHVRKQCAADTTFVSKLAP